MRRIRMGLTVILCLMCLGILADVYPGLTASKNLKVSYIDVGQSDCVLIQQGGKSMLIDAGDVGDGPAIVSYLKKKKIKRLDYVVATHPHADHIGGMQDVIETFSVGKIIMSKKSHTTLTFSNLIKAIQKKGLKLTEAKPGDKFFLGSALVTILAPNSYDYGSNINNYSVALRLSYMKNSFLFVGDCEKAAISDIIDNAQSLKADVIMCGHHGSANSTTAEWIDAVSPSYAVISVGKNNSYGHPSDDVLGLLKKSKIKCFRTDRCGTIVATSNGKKILFNTKPVKLTTSVSANKSAASSSATNKYVYVTKTGKKYHQAGCRYLSISKIKMKLAEARKNGFTPCSICCG